MSVGETDIGDLAEAPSSFERRHALRIEAGACPPREVLEEALRAMRSAPRWAALLSPRLYLLGDRVVGGGRVKAPPDESGEVEIGYGVAPDYVGRGIGRSGAQALIDAALAGGARSVVAATRPDNVASWRLLQTLGFECFGSLRDAEDEWLWCWRRKAN